MPSKFRNFRPSSHAALAAAALCLSFGAWAAEAARPDLAALKKRHDEERAVCTSGRSTQPLAACLAEADAAWALARRGQLADEGDTPYMKNQRARCAALPADQRTACLARMAGQGKVSGSVAEGGVLRELVTVVPGAPAAAASAASAP